MGEREEGADLPRVPKGDEAEVTKADDGGYVAEPLHHECVVCHARSTKSTPEEATMTLLLMMALYDHTLEDMVPDLCFYHRRQLDDCTKIGEKDDAS